MTNAEVHSGQNREIQESLNKILARFTSQAPGIALSLHYNGETYFSSTGTLCREVDPSANRKITFPLGSIARPLLYLLCHEGCNKYGISLETKISDLLPSIRNTPYIDVSIDEMLFDCTDIIDPQHTSLAEIGNDSPYSFLSKSKDMNDSHCLWSESPINLILSTLLIEELYNTAASDAIKSFIFVPLDIQINKSAPEISYGKNAFSRSPIAPTALHKFPIISSLFSSIRLDIESLSKISRFFCGKIDHPVNARSTENGDFKPIAGRPLARLGELFPTGHRLGLLSFSNLVGARHLGIGSSCGFLSCNSDEISSAVAMNSASPIARDRIMIEALSTVGISLKNEKISQSFISTSSLKGSYFGVNFNLSKLIIYGNSEAILIYPRGSLRAFIRLDNNSNPYFDFQDIAYSVPFNILTNKLGVVCGIRVGEYPLLREG